MERQTTNSRLTSVNREAADEFNYKGHASDGVYFVTDTSAAPTAKYYGFVVIEDAVVNTITHVNVNKQKGTITGITFPAGMYVPLPGLITTLTLTSGKVMLLKKDN